MVKSFPSNTEGNESPHQFRCNFTICYWSPVGRFNFPRSRATKKRCFFLREKEGEGKKEEKQGIFLTLSLN